MGASEESMIKASSLRVDHAVRLTSRCTDRHALLEPLPLPLILPFVVDLVCLASSNTDCRGGEAALADHENGDRKGCVFWTFVRVLCLLHPARFVLTMVCLLFLTAPISQLTVSPRRFVLRHTGVPIALGTDIFSSGPDR